MAGEILRMAKWQAARPVINQASIQMPDELTVIAFQLEGNAVETGVLVRHNKGRKQAFVDFHVEGKPFKATVATLKRRRTIAARKLECGGLL